MTPLQHRIYQYLQQYLEAQGYSPSFTEIAQGIGISPNSISLISRNIHQMVKAGELQFNRKGYRNLQIAPKEKEPPLMGALTQLSSLKVTGNHYQDLGIWDGDFVLYQPDACASEGQLIVAAIDQQEATLHRLSYQIPERITLISTNPQLKPKAYLPHRVQIKGVYAGLIRLHT